MPAIARSISAAIFCFLFAGSGAKPAQDDWLTYRHDPARTGAQPFASDLSDAAQISGLHIVAKWPPDGSPIKITGGFKASPIVVDGTVFIGGVNGYFYALDAASGALKWQYPRATDPALLGSSVSCPNTDTGYGGYGTYGIATGATFAVIGGQKAVIFGAPDPTAPPLDPTGHGFGSARLFAFPLSGPLPDPNKPWIWESDVVAQVTGCTSSKVDVNKSLGELHERIAYSSPLVLGDTVYVGIHDTGDSPIQQGRVVAVDLNTGHLTGFKFLGAGNAPGDGNIGGGVWNALATDGTGVYFTTGNSHWPWCSFPYSGGNCPPNARPFNAEPQPNNGLSMIRADKDTGSIVPHGWKYQPVPFNLDGDPDWAAGATVMSTSCGELIASVQKDGWSYAIDANTPSPGPSCPLTGNSWQFPPTTNGCPFSDTSLQHGDDDYRRPGAAWGDVFIVRTGGEANTNISKCNCEGGDCTLGRGKIACRGYSELHALNACATSEQDRVRWIADIPDNIPSSDGHISYSSPTVTGGIVFIGTRQNPNDNAGHLVVLGDPSVAPASQQVCSNPDVHVAACNPPYAPVWSLQRLADISMPDSGSLASMRNEPVLAEGKVFVATNPYDPNGSGHVYILAPKCSCNFFQDPAVSQLYLGPNTCPIQVAQSGTSQALLVMGGPWVASDHGLNANGVVVDKDSLPGGSTINLTPGFEDLGPGGVPQSSDGLMGINVSVPASAPVGQYCVAVQATDPATRVSAVADVPINIYACKPLTVCPPGACGTFPDGCGGNLQCGVCQANEVCTGGGCCNPFVNVCGKRCPPLQVFCPKTDTCVDPRLCPSMNCRVVNGITECQ